MTPQDTPTKEGVNYKDTLNLPQTGFRMKAGAATREPEIEAFWDENRVYEQAVAARDKTNKFVLHDGPPYLSSDKIHIGTALNKILKDIVTRYKYQRGFYAPYVPGYDSHGLPIENAVVKNIKGGRSAIGEVELRKKCRAFALGNLKGQETNFKRLGVWGRWEEPYITLNAEYEATQAKLFGEMYKKGYVYKGLKPVYWCPVCETALADAEVEYANHKSHSIYVAFPVTEFEGKLGSSGATVEEAVGKLTDKIEMLQGAYFVIWTTTPWTLPANLALAVHPEFTYHVLEAGNGKRYVVVKELAEDFVEKANLGSVKLLGELKGAELEGLAGQHPFLDRTSPVMLGTHVTTETGTGIVHTAPGHGMEDYVVAQEYKARGLDVGILSPLDNAGRFTEEAGLPKLVGQPYYQGNGVVVEALQKAGALLHHSLLEHSYPHCWRCHNPVIYRATDQWFINVSNPELKQTALDEIKKVSWIPGRGESRITAMVEGRTDWCISRQRVWGVPIPVFYDKNTGEVLLSDAIIQHVYEQFKAGTSDVWWEKSAEELLAGLPEAARKELDLDNREVEKETDIMDVWFDSGISHTAVVEARADELGHLPVELYLEGSDQHRGWFQSALWTSVMLHHIAPYKTVLTHGFVLDQDGRKMSKSLGNVVDPNTVMKQYGADILRLWVASVDYTQDIRIGNTILQQLAETYKKVRNTFRFMLGNLYDFNPAIDAVAYDQLSMLDQYTLHRLQGLVERVTADFDRFEYHRYNHEIQWFSANDLSALYFDVAKDILYCDANNAPRRRAIQTVLYETLLTLLPMLVPIMPHMAEDIWENLPEGWEKPVVSATLLDWPAVKPEYVNKQLATDFQVLLALKETVNLALETPRSQGQIGSSLEASVRVRPTGEIAKTVLASLSGDELAAFLITSTAELVDTEPAQTPGDWQSDTPGEGNTGVHVYAFAAEGGKCQRCWRYDTSVGRHTDHPAICDRCAEAVTSV